MNDKVRCPKCGKLILPSTLEKNGGVCRHCVRSLGGHRTAAIAFAVFTVAVLLVAWMFEAELATAIAEGREMKTHFVIAAIYNRFGIWGARCLFGAMSLFGMFMTFRFTRLWLVQRKHVREVTNA